MRTLPVVVATVIVIAFVASFAGAQGIGPGTSTGNRASLTPQQQDPDKCTSYSKADYGEKNYIGDWGNHLSVGSKATASFFRYNVTNKKASFNERTLGVGLSIRYYADDQLQNANGATSIQTVPKACRARTEDLLDFARTKSDGTLAKVGSWISISPTLFVSKAESDADVAIQPAIVVGFLNDIISVGTAYNLTGTGKGQWSILVGPSYGFQW